MIKLNLQNPLTKELKDLVKNGKFEVNCQEVKDSEIYKILCNGHYLQLGGAEVKDPFTKFTHEELLLITKIAAVSPTLIYIDYKYCNLQGNASTLTGIISKSPTIEFVGLSYNDLRLNSIEAVKSLMVGPHSKMIIDLNSCFCLREIFEVLKDTNFPLIVALGGNFGWPRLELEAKLKNYNKVNLDKYLAFRHINPIPDSPIPVEIIVEIVGKFMGPIELTFDCASEIT